MSQVSLTFTFNLPEENTEFEVQTHAGRMHSVILAFTNACFREDDWPQDVKDEWYALLAEYEVDILSM